MNPIIRQTCGDDAIFSVLGPIKNLFSGVTVDLDEQHSQVGLILLLTFELPASNQVGYNKIAMNMHK